MIKTSRQHRRRGMGFLSMFISSEPPVTFDHDPGVVYYSAVYGARTLSSKG